jgi:two-component system alkaline phosphatase synthesis response regulator PhoP
MAKILIAEDERDIRDLITFTLQFAGHEVIATTNGQEAYDMALTLKDDPPDLILMDVRMPRMTGYEACQRIKAEESIRDIPIVFLSAKGQESEVQTGLRVGAVEYILKPFAPDQLTSRVQEILQTYSSV